MSTGDPTPLTPASFAGLIGIAEEDITPPPGIYARNWGAARSDVATGVHRPLRLSCVTFQAAEGGAPLVLIGADLGWWKRTDDERFVRESLLRAFGLPPERLMFCFSHTHAGPGLCREDADNPGGDLIGPYLETLRERARAAVGRALDGAAPAVLTWQYGRCTLATARDLPDPDRGRFVVGYNPELPADDTLLVGRVTARGDGRTLAVVVNYACHPTTLGFGNRLISPDYVGAMREVVECQTGAPCLFLQGASGELAPAEQYSDDVRLADAHGRQVAYSVLATLEGMLPPGRQLVLQGIVESGAPLAVWRQSDLPPSGALSADLVEVELPLKPLPSLAEIESALSACHDRVERERLWRKRLVRKSVGDGDRAVVPLWVWRLGDSFLFGQPNEAYSYLQQELRRELAPRAAAVMNVVNGHIGYLPRRELYTEDLYAVWQTPFAAGSLELLARKAAEAARGALTR